mgnify:CR=1 FL=1
MILSRLRHHRISLRKISLGVQNISPFLNGAYTGEVSADMLLGVGIKTSIIGHSERRKYFNESEIVELSMTVAFFVGFGRLAASYHMVEELPESFQANEKETLTPWGNDSIIVR